MKALAWSLLVLCVIWIIGLSTYCVLQDFYYNRDCGNWLKLAADAPTIERANDFLSRAVFYLNAKDKTHGNSAIILKTPKNDIGIWYSQITSAKQNLVALLEKGDQASQLEKDNSLMKLRETLLDSGEGGKTELTEPQLISLFPKHRVVLALWLLLLADIGVTIYLFFRIYS